MRRVIHPAAIILLSVCMITLSGCDFFMGLFGLKTNTTAIPSTPTGVQASAGDGQVTVSWAEVSGATSYNIYYAAGNTVFKGGGTKMGGAVSPDVISSLTNGTTYACVVTAVNKAGESGASAVVTATPTASAPNVSTMVVGSGGGTISLPSGTRIDIPAGALSANVQFTVKAFANSSEVCGAYGMAPFTGGIDVTPDDVAFSLPVTIRIPTGEAMAPGTKRAMFTCSRGSGIWTECASEAVVDDTGLFATAEVTHFCPIALSPFPSHIFSKFQAYFNGTNVEDALLRQLLHFESVTNILCGKVFTTNSGNWRVKGILMTVDYSLVQNAVEILDSKAVVSDGDSRVDPANAYTYRSETYDYLDSSGEIQLEYWIDVNIAFEPIQEDDAFSVAIAEPYYGKQVADDMEPIVASINLGKSGRQVSRVEFYVDDVLVDTRALPPWNTIWDTAGVANGAHTLKIAAYNTADQAAISPIVIVKKGGQDKIPPLPRGGGQLTFTDVGTETMTLHLKEATDDVSSGTFERNLEYCVVRSTQPNIADPANALANGTVVQNWTYRGLIFTFSGSILGSLELTGLTPDTLYYVNVLVRDPAGNMASYVMSSQRTEGAILTFSSNPANGAWVNALSSVDFTYSEAVTGADTIDNYALSGAGLGTLAKSTVALTSGTTYRLNLTGEVGEGQIIVTISNVKNVAGNPLSANTLTLNASKHMYVSTTGSDDNPGTPVSPKLTISAAIAAATPPCEVRVEKGVYAISAQIDMREGVSLMGGYAIGFGSWDVKNNVTTISDARTIADQVQAINFDTGITNLTYFDGFTVNGPASTGNRGSCIFIGNGGSSAPIIQNNILKANTGYISVGIFTYANNATPIMRNNIIEAGTGSNSACGIAVALSKAIIENNVIFGGYSPGGTCGVNWCAWSTTTSYSIVVRNNIILSGVPSGSSTSGAIWFYNTQSFWQNNTVQNNILCAISSGTGNAYAVMNDDYSRLTFENNIAFCVGSASSGFGFYEEDSYNCNPDYFLNNNIFDCPSGLYRNASHTCTTEAGLNTESYTTLGAAGTADNNIVVDMIDPNYYFTDWDGPDNDVTTVEDNDWHLKDGTACPTSIKQGGMDLSGSFGTDMDGTIRTAPWSIGPYENDN